MAPFPFDVVVFDLDGTLADTAPDLAASLNHALGALGRATIAPEEVRNLVGHGSRVLIQRGLTETGETSEELVDKGLALFLAFYADNICNGTRAYDGVVAQLDSLHRRGVRTAICTNKPEKLTLLLVDALGWHDRFDAIVGADTLAVRKPDPAPLHEAIARAGGGRAVLVGDSITDAETARAAEVPFVAVSFGFSDRPVKELGADAVIDDYVELIPALERLLSPSP